MQASEARLYESIQFCPSANANLTLCRAFRIEAATISLRVRAYSIHHEGLVKVPGGLCCRAEQRVKDAGSCSRPAPLGQEVVGQRSRTRQRRHRRARFAFDLDL